jgi:hypothetical protein
MEDHQSHPTESAHLGIPGSLAFPINIQIIGGLILPHPRLHFPEEQGWAQRILDLLPDIHQLDARDLCSKLT